MQLKSKFYMFIAIIGRDYIIKIMMCNVPKYTSRHIYKCDEPTDNNNVVLFRRYYYGNKLG